MREEAAKAMSLASGNQPGGKSPAGPEPEELLVVQHVPHEGPGRIRRVIRESELRCRVVETYKGDSLPGDLSQTRGLVLLGGPEVGEDAGWSPQLLQEMILIGKALDRKIPVLGISLGAELLAATLGARVHPSAYLEIGWLECSLQEAALADPLFRGEAPRFHAFHWHGDVFELPPGAVALVSGELERNHAFRWGESTYGFRFHLEMTPAQITALVNGFLLGDATLEEEAQAVSAGIGLYNPAVRPLAERVLGRWVDQVVSGPRPRSLEPILAGDRA